LSESQATSASPPRSHDDHPQTGPIVQINVNGTDVPIHRGHQTVVQIKDAGKVPHPDVLEQLVNGQLNELKDDGAVVIKGGEKFVSHIRGASSS
jgi:hypothetical protein